MNLIINDDSCNGEEREFSSWVNKNYPNINVVYDNYTSGGLYDADGNVVEYPVLWDEYCNA